MKKRFISMLLLTAILLVACNSGNPQIGLEVTFLDLGDVVNGEIVSREVTVRNDGTKELVVESVSTSCGCTQASVDPMTIPPGGSATLFIEFDSGSHGPELTGKLVRQVFIMSNDPQQEEAMVELAANILLPEE